MPKLLIKRTSEFENWARKIKIMLNGDVMVKIKNGEKIALDIPAGSHTLQAKIDWCASNTLKFEVDNSSEIEVVLSSGDGSSLSRLLFRTKEYLKLTITSS